MPAAILTSKGQVTIPLVVRTALGLHAGTRVDFVRVDDGFKLVPLHKDTSSLKGRFAGRVVKPVSIEAMDGAIGAEVTRSFAPSKR